MGFFFSLWSWELEGEMHFIYMKPKKVKLIVFKLASFSLNIISYSVILGWNMTMTCFWQIPCDWPVYSGTFTTHIHTYTLSYPTYSFSWRNLQQFKGTKEVRGDSDALFKIIHTRWAYEGPGSSRFPFSQQWFLYMIVFLIFWGVLFIFLI